MTPRAGLLLLAVALGLAACGGDNSDLERYVAEVRDRPSEAIEPIPEIADYAPYTYHADDRRGPFTPNMPEPERRESGPTPDTDREREPLESYPLDALRMVGTISRGGTMYALIEAPDNVIHRVTRGDHMGQNYGEVTAVSDNGIALSEIVSDGAGSYVRRPAALAPTQ